MAEAEQDFPPLTSPKGEFMPYDPTLLDTMSEKRRQIYETCREAFEKNAGVEAAIKSTDAEIAILMAEDESLREQATAVRPDRINDLVKSGRASS